MPKSRCRSLTAMVPPTVLLLQLACQCASAQNNFFGSMPGGPGGDPSQPIAPAAATNQLPADYTDDEKRMQKKYKEKIRHARSLITKGERMMKSGQTGKDDKVFKRGKVIKEIGERQLAELTANNPFPEPEKIDKKKLDGNNNANNPAADTTQTQQKTEQ